MANQHDYINYNDMDLLASHKKKQLEFVTKEYRFNIKATKENHKKLDEFFKNATKEIMDLFEILNIDYYKWEKEGG